MLTLHSPQVLQETALRWKRDFKVSLVPTMGAIHEGHLKLVEIAKNHGQKVIVSLFVNPLQFAPGEDLDNYPRPFDEDQASLDAAGADVLFAPSVKELYPPGFSTQVRVPALSAHLCGPGRPGHFEGVATVCLKLFQVSQTDFAVFGEKDFQQLRLLEQLVADLNLPLTIIRAATVRERDGLALSSRNRYLSPEQRQRASFLPAALKLAVDQSQRPEVKAGEILALARSVLSRARVEVEYLAIASEADLVPVDDDKLVAEIAQARIFLAARLDKTRLIDNAALGGREKGEWFRGGKSE